MCGTPAGKDSSESVRNAVLRLGEMGPRCQHVTLQYGPAPGGTEDRLPCGLSGGLRISRKHPLITPKSKWEFQPFYSRRAPLGNNHPPGQWPTREDWPFLVSSGHTGSQEVWAAAPPPFSLLRPQHSTGRHVLCLPAGLLHLTPAFQGSAGRVPRTGTLHLLCPKLVPPNLQLLPAGCPLGLHAQTGARQARV